MNFATSRTPLKYVGFLENADAVLFVGVITIIEYLAFITVLIRNIETVLKHISDSSILFVFIIGFLMLAIAASGLLYAAVYFSRKWMLLPFIIIHGLIFGFYAVLTVVTLFFHWDLITNLNGTTMIVVISLIVSLMNFWFEWTVIVYYVDLKTASISGRMDGSPLIVTFHNRVGRHRRPTTIATKILRTYEGSI